MRDKSDSSTLRKALCIPLLASLLWSTQVAAGNTGAHETAYREALGRLQTAPALLAKEVNRLRSAEVLHFDYLQYAHIELLRDAKAVRYPPSSLESSQRESLTDLADEVLRVSAEMEFTLSDFLRGQAALNGALSSTVDIARSASLHADTETEARLVDLGRAATRFRNVQNEENRAALDQAFAALAERPLELQFRNELAAQLAVIDRNSDVAERAITRMNAHGLERAIGQLLDVYERARH